MSGSREKQTLDLPKAAPYGSSRPCATGDPVVVAAAGATTTMHR